MSKFIIFNELSLPLSDTEWRDELRNYATLVDTFREHGISSIRTQVLFSEVTNFTQSKSLAEFFGGLPHDLKSRLRSLLFNQTNTFSSPLIEEHEAEEHEELNINSEFYYNGNKIDGGLACAHIWNTISISFPTHSNWSEPYVTLTQDHIEDGEKQILIEHASSESHIDIHREVINQLISSPSSIGDLIEFGKLLNTKYQFVVKFTEQASSHLEQLEEVNSELIIRVYELVKSIKMSPGEGIGKPELLKYDLAGYSSRRITEEHRIVYKQIEQGVIEVSRCYGHYE
ncbi:Txe/YoeB family addiction module toxin [Photobacterium leiognathi]|uniref:Txe/YoeB family addiction module toxin n=1 Tax=Photobacterium leiognathi TaxID=553611 RepID=UPI003AF3F039